LIYFIEKLDVFLIVLKASNRSSHAALFSFPIKLSLSQYVVGVSYFGRIIPT